MRIARVPFILLGLLLEGIGEAGIAVGLDVQAVFCPSKEELLSIISLMRRREVSKRLHKKMHELKIKKKSSIGLDPLGPSLLPGVRSCEVRIERLDRIEKEVRSSRGDSRAFRTKIVNQLRTKH